MIDKIIKECPKHGLTEHSLQVNGSYKCVECRKQAVTNIRKRNKLKIVEYKGGKCEICGYDKCIDALEFHHLKPEEKEFGLSNGNTVSFEKMKREADKCIMVCANCHREIHAKERKEKILEEERAIKERIESFNINHRKIKELTEQKNKTKPKQIKLSSSKEELIELFSLYKNFSQVGKILGISDNAVRKRCKKVGLPIHTQELKELLGIT